MFYLHS
ncbi:Protein CBG27428 [Caenorhabditis briggsae]|nr:Protein CBG27428 [Caenorhabditis briggsae]CAS00235.1 Protein CBG27428 [Caenorhabditis briggsae]